MAVVDASSDNNFDALASTVTATTVDNDTAGFTLGAISATVAETGTTATFTVVLDAEPDSNVVISVTSGDTGRQQFLQQLQYLRSKLGQCTDCNCNGC